MCWIIDTCGPRGSGIKETWRWFEMDGGRRVRIMDTTVVHRRSEKMENNSIGGRMDTLVVALGWWISRMMHCRECGNIEEYDGKIVSLQKNMVVKRNNCGRMGQ